MKDTVLATYTRISTLWKNANALYKEKDWVKMECIFRDLTEEREFAGVNKLVVKNEDGIDISDTFFGDRNIIRLTNNSGANVKEFTFYTRDDANKFFKRMYGDQYLTGWRKVN